MLKSRSIIAVIFGLAILSAEALAQTAPEDQPRQEESTTDADQNSQNQNENSVRLTSALEGIESAIRDLIAEEDKIETQRQQDAEDRDLKAQEGMAWWAELMFYSAVATVILTVVALFAIIRTLHHTRRAADYTKDMLTEARRGTSAVNRAWIKVNILPGTYNLDEEGAISFNVSVEIQNTGTTPAMKAHTAINAVIDYDQAKLEVELLASAQATSEYAETASRIVFPNETYIRPWCPVIDGSAFRERGYITSAIIGCVSYRTNYDSDVHQTAFVFGVTFEDGDISPRNEEGNCEYFVLSGGFAT